MKRLKTWHLVAVAIALPILYYGLPSLGISLGSVLLFLLVLACPLFHLLGMHGGHAHGGHSEARPEAGQVPAAKADGAGPEGTPGR